MNVHISLGTINVSSGSVVAIGIFDGLHAGHIAVIREAVRKAEQAGLRCVVMTFSFTQELHPSKKQTGQKLITETLFQSILEDLGVNDIIALPFSYVKGMSAEFFVSEILSKGLAAKIVLCGQNFRFARGGEATPEDMQRIGTCHAMEVTSIPLVMMEGEPVSSTRIRIALAKGDLSIVNRMLGRRYAFDFEVVHGGKIGREMGFPTINQQIPEDFIRPRLGVYASNVMLDGVRWLGATNIGKKPTVGSDYVLAETHIIGYGGDLYGRRIWVELLEFIRSEEKFADMESLARRMKEDCEIIKETAGRG